MALSKEYITEWRRWHDDRVAWVNRPYGIMAVVCQDWLVEGEFFTSEFVPGQWLLKDGEIIYFPDQETTEKGEFLTIAGKEVTTPTVVPHGHNQNSGTGSGVPAFFKDLEVETITRLNSRDERIFALRVRDPKEAARKRFDDIETFPASEEWVVPAKYTPADVSLHNVPTVEDGIYEASFTIGTIDLQIKGQNYTLNVSGHRGGSKETGYFADMIYVHIGDLTNRHETYGGGRIVKIDPAELNQITHLDLNRLISFSCAFSTFIACPSTPPSNRLPFRVTAGEFVPPIPHERIPTYRG